MKPNVHRKIFYSDILGTSFRLWISTKARKCIMKAGSFDNYLTTTKPEVLDSRMALHLRDLMRKKMKNPQFVVPYVPGQASLPRTTRKHTWEYRHMPAVYMPTHVRMSQDTTEFYLKTP